VKLFSRTTIPIKEKVYKMNKPKTLGELKKSGYKPSSIQNEISKNLSDKISKGQNSFEGLVGYEKNCNT
jgi:hypothetical protein